MAEACDSPAVTSDARRRWLPAAFAAAAACASRPLPFVPEADAAGTADAPGAAAFQAVAPCSAEADYATGTETVTFGFFGTPAGFSYDPKCLAIDAGRSVTFSGTFSAHPLYPSARRGTLANNPIGGVSSGDSKVVPFPRRGFYAYYCGAHGAADDGSAMEGVVWVR
jgi:plastocyanin